MKKIQFKNFTLKNTYYTFQGHYRSWITKQYMKFNDNASLATKIINCSECLGNHPTCGCPWAELLLSDKPIEKCQTLH